MAAAATVVRSARPDEHAALRRLTLDAYAEYALVMEPAAWAGLEGAVESALVRAHSAEWIVAETNGRILGSVLLFPPEIAAYDGAVRSGPGPVIRLLAVAPEARGENVGRALVEECIRRARQAGATEIGLHTSRSMNAAIRLYRRMGFARAPEYDFQPDGAELVTAYRLDLSRDDRG
jgi:GNAT superfamily N-acetyltransferase